MSNPNPNDQQPSPENTTTGILNPSPIKPVKKSLSKKTKALLTISMCVVAASVGSYFYADNETKNATGVWELTTEYGNITTTFAKSYSINGNSIVNASFDQISFYLPRGYTLAGKNITFTSAYNLATQKQEIRFNLTMPIPNRPISSYEFRFTCDAGFSSSFNGHTYVHSRDYPPYSDEFCFAGNTQNQRVGSVLSYSINGYFGINTNESVNISNFEFILENSWNQPFSVALYNCTYVFTKQYIREDWVPLGV